MAFGNVRAVMGGQNPRDPAVCLYKTARLSGGVPAKDGPPDRDGGLTAKSTLAR
jgi:hypothetical protein